MAEALGSLGLGSSRRMQHEAEGLDSRRGPASVTGRTRPIPAVACAGIFYTLRAWIPRAFMYMRRTAADGRARPWSRYAGGRVMSTHHAAALSGVSRSVRHGDRLRPILQDVDLAITAGSVWHIVGPSGSGKSSLLRLINRLDDPDAGRVEVLGQPVADWPVRALRRRVAMVFQEPTLLGRTVRENLALPFELHEGAPPDLDARIDAALGRAGVGGELIDRRGHELSVGQKQRVALARTLVTEPEVLLLDEPTAALDPRTAERLLKDIERFSRSAGCTCVIATHRLGEARRVGGQLAVVIEGRVEAVGPVDAVFADPPNERVRQFLHGGGDDD